MGKGSLGKSTRLLNHGPRLYLRLEKLQAAALGQKRQGTPKRDPTSTVPETPTVIEETCLKDQGRPCYNFDDDIRCLQAGYGSVHIC